MKKQPEKLHDLGLARTRLHRLQQAVQTAENAVILAHTNPDPDAIASSVAMQTLLEHTTGLHARILYKGIIGRAENHALVRYLEHPMERMLVSDLRAAACIVLVDTQPGTGNNALSNQEDITATVVVDHHSGSAENIDALHVDVRPEVGAVSTLLVEYLYAAGIPLDTQLATALFYGIETDTMSLQRGTSPLDHWAFCQLLPHVDFEAIATIQRAQVPPEYFRSIASTLQSATIHNNTIVSYVGEMNYPDLTADMADLLLRMRGCRWVLCQGVYRDTLHFSLRTQNKRGAGQLAQQIAAGIGSAGGHGSMAGGQIPLQDQDANEMANSLRQRLLQQLEIDEEEHMEQLVESGS